jgi:hypothetical protein
MGDTPAAILYDANGAEIAIADGVVMPAGKQAIVIAGQDPSGNAKFIRTSTEGFVQTSQALASRVVVADYYRPLTSATSYFLGIDLDNAGGSGPYKHGSGTAVKMVGVSSVAQKYRAQDDWDVLFGAILSINGVQAVIGWLGFGSTHLQSTIVLKDSTVDKDFPVPVDMSVSGGDYTKIASGFKETVTAVNTGVTIPDVSGVNRTPAAGDVIIRARRNSGTGDLLFHFCFWYLVE